MRYLTRVEYRRAGLRPAELWMNLEVFKAALVLASLFLTASPTGSDEVNRIPIDAAPTGFSRFALGAGTFGKLQFRGGLVLSSPDSRFGGLSGLALSAAGDGLLAISDDGWWFKADVQYEGARLAGIANAELAPILNKEGHRPSSKSRRDAEALAVDPPGVLDADAYVGFESRTRIEKFSMRETERFAARPVRIASPAALAQGPRNAQLEALGRLTRDPGKGSLVAISERNLDGAGNIRGWIIDGRKNYPFSILRFEDYDITDLAILPDGSIVTLERSYSKTSLPGMAVRRFTLEVPGDGRVIRPDVLFSGRQPFYLIDNMEGIAAHRSGGEQRITIVSDDNYNRGVQRTLMFQFALPR